ncbi:litaf-like protein [Cystoisospora suis]|uniref:Litaf-like protein n=1 Tax=Cystoisospora suis TaxID=483139 RepID=A0A2C6K9Z6_9APIC|nr:litaf-like protein [Cystoisospora suis]
MLKPSSAIEFSSTPVPTPIPNGKDHPPASLPRQVIGSPYNPSSRASSSSSSSSFGDVPVNTTCPHCHKAITTTVSYKHSCMGITLCVLTTLVLGLYSFCVVPFLWLGLKDAVHSCPFCRNLIQRQSRISIPLFSSSREEIVTVKCGSCAVVLSRRYFLLFFCILFFILLFYILRAGWLGNALDILPKGELTEASWGDFYRDCGQKSQLGNPLQAVANFRDKFGGKTVRWTGLVKHVKEGLFSSNFLFLVMYPTMTLAGQQHKKASGHPDSFSSSPFSFGRTGGGEDMSREGGEGSDAEEKRKSKQEKEEEDQEEEKARLLALDEENRGLQGDGADLALAFSGDLNQVVEKLVPGDKVSFEATLVELGRRGKPTLGRLWSVSVIESWESREKRLRELAKAQEQEAQHLLSNLFPSAFGSPFGGFNPFNLMGSLGGRGVVVIRKQIITSPDPEGSPIAVRVVRTFTDDGPLGTGRDTGGGEEDGSRRHPLSLFGMPWGDRGGDRTEGLKGEMKKNEKTNPSMLMNERGGGRGSQWGSEGGGIWGRWMMGEGVNEGEEEERGGGEEKIHGADELIAQLKARLMKEEKHFPSMYGRGGGKKGEEGGEEEDDFSDVELFDEEGENHKGHLYEEKEEEEEEDLFSRTRRIAAEVKRDYAMKNYRQKNKENQTTAEEVRREDKERNVHEGMKKDHNTPQESQRKTEGTSSRQTSSSSPVKKSQQVKTPSHARNEDPSFKDVRGDSSDRKKVHSSASSPASPSRIPSQNKNNAPPPRTGAPTRKGPSPSLPPSSSPRVSSSSSSSDNSVREPRQQGEQGLPKPQSKTPPQRVINKDYEREDEKKTAPPRRSSSPGQLPSDSSQAGGERTRPGGRGGEQAKKIHAAVKSQQQEQQRQQEQTGQQKEQERKVGMTGNEREGGVEEGK